VILVRQGAPGNGEPAPLHDSSDLRDEGVAWRRGPMGGSARIVPAEPLSPAPQPWAGSSKPDGASHARPMAVDSRPATHGSAGREVGGAAVWHTSAYCQRRPGWYVHPHSFALTLTGHQEAPRRDLAWMRRPVSEQGLPALASGECKCGTTIMGATPAVALRRATGSDTGYTCHGDSVP
jgi:hypothetical protein